MGMKRSQAAMEFLITYGWAILMGITVLSALWYFGLLRPEQFLPGKCAIKEPGLFCQDQTISYERYPYPWSSYKNVLRFHIRNSAGHTYKLKQIKIKESEDFDELDWKWIDYELTNSNSYTVERDLEKTPPIESRTVRKVVVNFILEAENSETGLIHNYEGEIRTLIS